MSTSFAPDPTVTGVTEPAQGSELGRLRDIVDNLPHAVCYCDANLQITYANNAAKRGFRDFETSLNGRPDGLVGSAVDIFGGDAARLMRMLSDPRNLPYRTMIQLGGRDYEFEFGATHAGGAYLGPSITWTELKDAAIAPEPVAVQVADNGAEIALIAETLNESTNMLVDIAGQLLQKSATTNNQARAASSASEQIKESVAGVAVAAEEMSAAVREVAENASESAKTARRAKDLANATNGTISALQSSASAIGKVIKVISTIAQQTNLLALNATIEAARAGEAGKGFAVVANEVKELAKETARATEDITKRIEHIQADTTKSVEAIAEIAEVIELIDGYASSIAASVEEQAATTRDIARNAAEATSFVANVGESIQGAAGAAKDSENVASKLLNSANDVSRHGARLVETARP